MLVWFFAQNGMSDSHGMVLCHSTDPEMVLYHLAELETVLYLRDLYRNGRGS